MSDQFVGEIRMFAGNFAPVGWAFCNGQLMPISQNTALFSLLGTNYGGDGKATFGLPNLQGMSPMGQGTGSGLSPNVLGQTGGSATVTLTTAEVPSHTHQALGVAGAGTSTVPSSTTSWAEERRNIYAPAAASPTTMNANALSLSGGNQAHNNLPAYLVVSFIIALQGIYPPRS